MGAAIFSDGEARRIAKAVKRVESQALVPKRYREGKFISLMKSAGGGLGALGYIYSLSGPPSDPLEMQCTLTELDENEQPVSVGLPFPVWLFAWDVQDLGWADIDPPVQEHDLVPLAKLAPLDQWCCLLRFVGTCPQGP